MFLSEPSSGDSAAGRGSDSLRQHKRSHPRGAKATSQLCVRPPEPDPCTVESPHVTLCLDTVLAGGTISLVKFYKIKTTS